MSRKRPDSPSWTAAKTRGDEAELAVAEWFKSRGCDVTKTLGQDSYDLLVMMKREGCRRKPRSLERLVSPLEIIPNGR